MKHQALVYRLCLATLFAVAGSVWQLGAQSVFPDEFNPHPDGEVYSVIVQPDGKVLVSGWLSIGGQGVSCIARVHVDGTPDLFFTPKANFYVYGLSLRTDGKIVVGGYFSSVSGQDRYGLALVDAAGSVDIAFNPGVSYKYVSALAVQADGAILVGGDFMFLANQPRNCIGRLYSSGAVDTGFNPGADDEVMALALQPDGKVLVGGKFRNLGGQSRSHIGRLLPSGTIDPAFNPGASTNALCLAVQADGKILVGGNFTTLGGQPRNFLGRLNSDGSLDDSFNPGADAAVYSFSLQADGKILVSGGFTNLAGQTRKYVGRLNSDGSLDTSFDAAADGLVRSTVLQPDGKILLGGSFNMLGAKERRRLGRLNNTAPATQVLTYANSVVTWLRGGTSPEVWRTTLDYSADGVTFTNIGSGIRVEGGWRFEVGELPEGGTLRARGFIAASDKSGGWYAEAYLGLPVVISHPTPQTNNAGTTSLLSCAAGGSEPITYQWFKDGIPLTSGDGVAGAAEPTLRFDYLLERHEGTYTAVASNPHGAVTSYVARFIVTDPFVSLVFSINDLGPVHLGQTFTLRAAAVGTSPLTTLWFRDGVALPGATNSALAITNVQPADTGSYYVLASNIHGSYTSAVTSLAVNTAFFDPTFNGATVMSAMLSWLALQPDGKILAGYGVPSIGCGSPGYVFRFHPDGTADCSFKAATDGFVSAGVVQPDGKILLYGRHASEGITNQALYRVYPDGTLDSGFKAITDAFPFCFLVQPDGKILVGGGSYRVQGQPLYGLARLHADGALDTRFVEWNGFNGRTIECLALQPDGKILVGGNLSAGIDRNGLVRLHPNGTLDDDFKARLGPSVNTILVQDDGRILVRVGGALSRINADGTKDAGFNPQADFGVGCLTLQTDGKVLVGGMFNSLQNQSRPYLGRYDSNGMLDPLFNPGANNHVDAITLQPDGLILLGGRFTSLAEQDCQGIGRLQNTEPATQTLACDGTRITWLRGGSSPEVWRTTFECSTNANDWLSLGAGVRIPGGWQITNAPAPTGATVRARGFVAAGNSGWFVESYATNAPAVQTEPPILEWARSADAHPHLILRGPSGGGYAIESRQSLHSGNWQVVCEGLSLDAQGTMEISLKPGTNATSFYRAVRRVGSGTP